MYQVTPAELNFVTGLVVGTAAGLALLLVPILWRVLLVLVFGWLAWRLTQLSPQELGVELLGLARRLATQGDFLRGALIAKAGIALTAFLIRRRAR